MKLQKMKIGIWMFIYLFAQKMSINELTKHEGNFVYYSKYHIQPRT